MNFYFPLVLFCLATSITPGPNNLMIMMSGINFGIRRSLPHYLGICFGFSFMVLLVGLGLSKVFTLFPELHQLIKVAGSIYMLYLAAKIIFSNTQLSTNNLAKRPLTYIQAVLFQWVNPKAWIMAIGAISAYTTLDGNIYLQAGIIALLFLVLGGPCVGCWLLGGMAIRKYIRNPRHMRMINFVLGGLLALSVLLVVF